MPESSIESTAATRNALTKITGIFGRAQKPRWIQDFHILFSHSDPNRRYKPGEVVRGEVHIKPTKPVRVTHITIALYGYAQVFKSFNVPGDGTSREASNVDPSRLLNSPGIVKLFNPVERTLHGECKLPSRLLRFEFAIPLPSHRLPTSIDFERGSIAYQLVATITRPTAIAPVLRCEPRKVYVNEDIDIAIIPSPKPRVVTLEPVEAKSKSKKGKKTKSTRTNSDSTSGPSDRPDSSASSRSDSRASFSHSDNASISNGSVSVEFRQHGGNNSTSSGSNNGGSNGYSNHGSGGTGESNGTNGNCHRNSRNGAPANSSKIVYASAELLRGGFLPGDKIPVHVFVAHTKPIRSMCGVIITLYRKTHIDTQPVLHKTEYDENGRANVRTVTPDIYEKSITGLSGLSLSNSGTSSTYRMDIAQTTLPLIIDPTTLRHEFTTNVEIPHEGLTPTITKVRGQSIDFRYYIEVCLDLQGKLESSRFLPRLTAQPLYGFGKTSTGGSTSVPLNIAQQGTHLIDTQLIRRERPQLVAWQFHVVIGTRDSDRAAKKRQRNGWKRGDGPVVLSSSSQTNEAPRSGENNAGGSQEEWHPPDNLNFAQGGAGTAHGYEHGYDEPEQVHEIGFAGGNASTWNGSTADLNQPPPSLPMPEEPLTEKERLRRYEEGLLPSAPPPLDDDEPSSSAAGVPSAPPAGLIDGEHDASWAAEADCEQYANFSRPRLQSKPSQASHLTMVEEDDDQIDDLYGSSRAPASSSDHLSQMSRSASSRGGPASISSQPAPRQQYSSIGMARSTSDPSDDKHELERRRLMAERSAPHYEGDDEDVATAAASASQPAASSSRQVQMPSVPGLGDLVEGEEHHHAAFGDWDAGPHDMNDELPPRYEQ